MKKTDIIIGKNAKGQIFAILNCSNSPYSVKWKINQLDFAQGSQLSFFGSATKTDKTIYCKYNVDVGVTYDFVLH